LSHLPLFAGFVCVAGLLRAALDDRVAALFRPPLAEMIALSPDGQRVAYAAQDGGKLAIVIMNLEHPGPRRAVPVDFERDVALAPDDPPVRLRFLRWATNTRLVFAPAERVVPLPPVTDGNGRVMPNPDGPTRISPILAVDADGRQRGTLVDAKDFMDTPADARRTLADLLRTTTELVATRNEPVRWRMPHLDILGFLPSDREQLILQTSGGYGRPAQHLVDIRTGSVREFGGDWPAPPGEPQVFDWHRLKVVGERKASARPTTIWRDEELGRVQRELEAKFPRRVVQVLDWSETRARVLFRVTGGSDPGRVFVFQRPEDLVLEILRHMPWLKAAKLNDTRFFEFAAPDAARLSGYLTWPKNPSHAPPPLLVVFPSGFPGQAQPAFDPEAQIFADLGFVVARLNHRSVAGIRAGDLNALRAGVDRVAVDDARLAIEWLAGQNPARPFDRRRVATLGRGFGGYLAVRALQLQPTVFRGGIAIDAPMELRGWLRPQETIDANAATRPERDIPAALIDHAGADWKKLSVLEQAEALANPVLLLVEPARDAAIDVSTEKLRIRLQALGRSPGHLALDAGFAAGRPESRATVYRKIEEFLNLRLHDHVVEIGPTEEVK
jgi:dipeptidyl aminopeptidase/acylaminoacyl peptidase